MHLQTKPVAIWPIDQRLHMYVCALVFDVKQTVHTLLSIDMHKTTFAVFPLIHAT